MLSFQSVKLKNGGFGLSARKSRLAHRRAKLACIRIGTVLVRGV